MLASEDDLIKSMTFLMSGVKLVMKTFPAESFSFMEQLKSLDSARKGFFLQGFFFVLLAMVLAIVSMPGVNGPITGSVSGRNPLSFL